MNLKACVGYVMWNIFIQMHTWGFLYKCIFFYTSRLVLVMWCGTFSYLKLNCLMSASTCLIFKEFKLNCFISKACFGYMMWNINAVFCTLHIHLNCLFLGCRVLRMCDPLSCTLHFFSISKLYWMVYSGRVARKVVVSGV